MRRFIFLVVMVFTLGCSSGRHQDIVDKHNAEVKAERDKLQEIWNEVEKKAVNTYVLYEKKDYFWPSDAEEASEAKSGFYKKSYANECFTIKNRGRTTLRKVGIPKNVTEWDTKLFNLVCSKASLPDGDYILEKGYGPLEGNTRTMRVSLRTGVYLDQEKLREAASKAPPRPFDPKYNE